MMSGSISEDIKQYPDERNEFLPEFCHSPTLVQDKTAPLPPPLAGAYLGDTNLNGRTYSHYQFDKALRGENRSLDILIPTDTNSPKTGIITDGLAGATVQASAQLYQDGFYHDQRWAPNQFAPHTLRYNPFNVSVVRHEPSLPNGGTWDYYSMKRDIHWVYRNPETLAHKKLRYLYSVPFDIVTFPVQLVGGAIICTALYCFDGV
jgi:hypothetical protein